MNLVEYPDRELMMFSLADTLAADLNLALRQNDRASFCVPGGTTPGPVFDVLSGVKLDWGRVTVFLNDERWVPETSDRSNGRLLRSRLLKGEAAAAQFVPLYADAPEPEAAIANLTAAIAPNLPISVLLLGMGADMHTASLFPGADRLAEALAPDAPVLVPMRAPGAGEPRVTLSAPAVPSISRAKEITCSGMPKRRAISMAWEWPGSPLIRR